MADIVDQHGRPIQKKLLTQEIAGPTVTGVRSILSDHPAQGLTPGRLGALLREAETGDAIEYLELAEEMEEKNLHYLAVLGTRKRQVSQLEIRVVPAGDDAQSIADADIVSEWLSDEMIEDELVSLMDALGKGFSVSEIIWETSEKQWMPQKIEHRDPRWFRFDYVDGKTMTLRDLENHDMPLPAYKFICHKFQAKSGLPIRGGFARMVAWYYLFSNYAIRDWVEFLATYGQPFRIGKFPPGAGQEDKATLLRALTNLGTDAAAMIPESMMLEFAQVAGSGGGSSGSQATAHSALLNYTDALISKAVLGQTLTTEAGDRGARSLGEVHDEVRHDIERSDAAALGQTLSRDVAIPIVKLNHGERDRYPKFLIGRKETIDIERITNAYSKLSPLGLKTKKTQWYDLLGLEAPTGDDETIGGAAPPPPGNEKKNKSATARAEMLTDEIDQAIEEALGDFESLDINSIDTIISAVKSAPDYDTLRAQIEDGSILKSMDSDEFAKLLIRLGFSLDISSR